MNEAGKRKAFISNKPYPVPIEMRPLWRICLIITSIAVVSGEKRYLDLKKVNILVWMLIRRSKWDEYEEFLLGHSSKIPLVSVDTATYKAVEFAIAKDFVRLEKGRLYLMENGEELFSLLNDNEIMQEEMDYLEQVGRKLTAERVKSLTGGLI